MIIRAAKSFNKWYNGIKEPWRFFFAFSLCIPVFAGMGSGQPLLVIGAISYACMLVMIRVSGV